MKRNNIIWNMVSISETNKKKEQILIKSKEPCGLIWMKVG